MNIYTAQRSSEKLFEFVNLYSIDSPNMYESTRQRFIQIQQQSYEVTNLISKLLNQGVDAHYGISDIDTAINSALHLRHFMQDILSSKYSPDSNKVDLLKSVLKDCLSCISEIYDESVVFDTSSISSRLDNIEKMLSNLHMSDTNNTSNINATKPSTSDTIEIDTNQVSTNIVNKNSASITRKSTMARFCSAFDKLARSDIPYSKVLILKQLLCRWFDTRIRKRDPKFFYRIEDLHTWINAIIIVYSYHVQNNSDKSFIAMFSDWLDKLDISGGKFALPYEIFNKYTHPDFKCEMITAYVIFDILKDSGLSEIIDYDPLYLQGYQIVDWAENHNMLDSYPYDDYKSDLSMLVKAKIN